MQTEVKGAPAFAYIETVLEPGETLVAESDAMTSMAADLDVKAEFNGGFVSGLCKKFLGGESLFVNRFTNNTNGPRSLTLTQGTPGDIREVDLDGGSIYLQPGAYIASTPGLKLGVGYAGIGSFIGREGLFRLQVSGTGRLWFGAYGALLDKEIQGEYIVDTSHLVAYEPGMSLHVQMAGGIISSVFSGEGLVTRVEGTGRIVIQSRSMSGLVSWLNPKLR
ncbi:MAG: TIGR00266 family protein [Lentisphaeria bacterium]|nr:TIGR00266 family protein [Lentisphaeria bacterium]